MNESTDPLEAELAALRPQEPSPELRERIHEQLTVPSAARPRMRVWLAMAAAMAAAVLAVAVLLPRRSGRIANQENNGGAAELPLGLAFDASRPTVWAFRSAVSGSANDLDSLLDKQTGSSHSTDDRTVPFRVFTPTDTEIRNLLGEL